MQTHTVKVTFENGDYFITDINGTADTVREYYKIGAVFNLGTEGDNFQKVTALQFLHENTGHFMDAVTETHAINGGDWSAALAFHNVD